MRHWILLFCTVLLSACQLMSSIVPSSGKAAPQPTPEPVIYVEEVPSAVDGLLSYAVRVRSLSNGEASRELAALANEPASPENTIRRALLLARNHGELPRALAQLELVIRSNDAEAAPFKPLAQLLQALWQERRKLDDQLERLSQQLKEEQRRAEEANAKLEALKKIENTLPARPSTGETR